MLQLASSFHYETPNHGDYNIIDFIFNKTAFSLLCSFYEDYCMLDVVQFQVQKKQTLEMIIIFMNSILSTEMNTVGSLENKTKMNLVMILIFRAHVFFHLSILLFDTILYC